MEGPGKTLSQCQSAAEHQRSCQVVPFSQQYNSPDSELHHQVMDGSTTENDNEAEEE